MTFMDLSKVRFWWMGSVQNSKTVATGTIVPPLHWLKRFFTPKFRQEWNLLNQMANFKQFRWNGRCRIFWFVLCPFFRGTIKEIPGHAELRWLAWNLPWDFGQSHTCCLQKWETCNAKVIYPVLGITVSRNLAHRWPSIVEKALFTNFKSGEMTVKNCGYASRSTGGVLDAWYFTNVW